MEAKYKSRDPERDYWTKWKEQNLDDNIYWSIYPTLSNSEKDLA
jgi:hypothetical protein